MGGSSSFKAIGGTDERAMNARGSGFIGDSSLHPKPDRPSTILGRSAFPLIPHHEHERKPGVREPGCPLRQRHARQCHQFQRRSQHAAVADVLEVSGTPSAAESFVDNVNRMHFSNWAEHEALSGTAPIEAIPYPRAKAAPAVFKTAFTPSVCPIAVPAP